MMILDSDLLFGPLCTVAVSLMHLKLKLGRLPSVEYFSHRRSEECARVRAAPGALAWGGKRANVV